MVHGTRANARENKRRNDSAIWVVFKNYGPFLGYPKYKVPYYNRDPKRTIILTTTHVNPPSLHRIWALDRV